MGVPPSPPAAPKPKVVVPGIGSPLPQPPQGGERVMQQRRIPVTTGIGMPVPEEHRPENAASHLLNSVYQDEVGRMLLAPEVMAQLPQWAAYIINQNRTLTIELQVLTSLLMKRGLITQVELTQFHQQVMKAHDEHFAKMVAQLGRQFGPKPPPAQEPAPDPRRL